MIRSVVEEDLFIIENIFKRSIRSVKPSIKFYIFITGVLMILLYPAIYFFYALLISFFICFIIYYSFYIFIENYIFTTSPLKNFYKYQTNNNKMLCLVVNDIIIGFTSVEKIDIDSVWVTYFFIDPEYQGKGYGVLLCDALFLYGTENNIHRLQGGTSSIQYPQLKLMRKYIKLLKLKNNNYNLELKRHNWFPIHEVSIIFTYNYNNYK